MANYVQLETEPYTREKNGHEINVSSVDRTLALVTNEQQLMQLLVTEIRLLRQAIEAVCRRLDPPATDER